MALEPEHGFVPDLGAIEEDVARRAKLMYLNYPNNPTGAVVPDGFFERVVEFARAYDILVVHDNAYSEIIFDGYRAPSFLATPGAKEVGIEVFSLSKGYNMTGWRCAVVVGNAEALRVYWQLKTNIDSGLFEAVQLAGVAALSPDVDGEVASMNELYRRRRDLVCDALHEIGVDVARPTERSTCGRRCRTASRARPPTASTSWSRRPSCCRRAPSTGRRARAGSASR